MILDSLNVELLDDIIWFDLEFLVVVLMTFRDVIETVSVDNLHGGGQVVIPMYVPSNQQRIQNRCSVATTDTKFRNYTDECFNSPHLCTKKFTACYHMVRLQRPGAITAVGGQLLPS